jgi:hypothetical protein
MSILCKGELDHRYIFVHETSHFDYFLDVYYCLNLFLLTDLIVLMTDLTVLIDCLEFDFEVLSVWYAYWMRQRTWSDMRFYTFWLSWQIQSSYQRRYALSFSYRKNSTFICVSFLKTRTQISFHCRMLRSYLSQSFLVWDFLIKLFISLF